MFKKAESAYSLPFAVPFHVGAYFRMGTYKHNVDVVIKIGAYIHGVLFLCGCSLSQFYGIHMQFETGYKPAKSGCDVYSHVT